MTALPHPAVIVPARVPVDIALTEAAQVVADQIAWWQSRGLVLRDARSALGFWSYDTGSWHALGLVMMRWWMDSQRPPARRNARSSHPPDTQACGWNSRVHPSTSQ